MDCLQAHINRYFSALIEVIVRNNGDVLRFAGDAVLCAWCVSSGASKETLTMCAQIAGDCALELLRKCDASQLYVYSQRLSSQLLALARGGY